MDVSGKIEEYSMLQWAVKCCAWGREEHVKCVETILSLDMLSVELLLNQNAQGQTALAMACDLQKDGIVELLVAHFVGKMGNQRDGDGDGDGELQDWDEKEKAQVYNEIMCCLDRVIRVKAESSVLKAFLQKGREVLLRDEARCHELLKEMVKVSENAQMLKVCGEHFKECLTMRNDNGETIAFYVVKFNKVELLKVLMQEFDCDVDVVNKDGIDLMQFCDLLKRSACREIVQQAVGNII